MANQTANIKDLSQRETLQSDAFSVYAPVYQQNLLNVPILKPVLIIICSGEKQLESKGRAETCYHDQFVFIAGSNSIGMRNIPKDYSYHAVLIEFEDDELPLKDNGETSDPVDFFIGDMNALLRESIAQFLEISAVYPEELLKLRRKEIISLLISLGYEGVFAIRRAHKLTDKITEIMKQSDAYSINISYISRLVGLSESTLHRRLKEENTSIKEIKDRFRMGTALHLIQTTDLPIGVIADRCGYQTHSKFSMRFKKHFGITPAELKKTQQAIVLPQSE
jgi:AraC-like DNA-binding protein